MSASNFDDVNRISDKPLFSSKELRGISDEMKADLDMVIKSMGDAIRFSMEEKTKAIALKELVFEKENEVQRFVDEITLTNVKITKNEMMIAETENELNRLKNAIEGIQQITLDLDPLDAERATSSLKGTMIKKQSDVEKLRGWLNSSKKLKDLTAKRLAETENALVEIKKHYSDKVSSAEVLVENIGDSISHIVKTYNDVISIAKELLVENFDIQHERSFELKRTSTESALTTEKEKPGSDEPIAT